MKHRVVLSVAVVTVILVGWQLRTWKSLEAVAPPVLAAEQAVPTLTCPPSVIVVQASEPVREDDRGRVTQASTAFSDNNALSSDTRRTSTKDANDLNSRSSSPAVVDPTNDDEGDVSMKDVLGYPFTDMFSIPPLESSVKERSCGADAVGQSLWPPTSRRHLATTVNRLLAVLPACVRGDRSWATVGVGCPLVSDACSAFVAELITCTASFDTWIACPLALPHRRYSTDSGILSTPVPDVVKCLQVHGVQAVEAWVPQSCKQTDFWSRVVRHACAGGKCALAKAPSLRASSRSVQEANRMLLGDVVARHQRCSTRPPFVPVEKRHPAPFGPPVECTTTSGRVVRIHPISFGYTLDAMEELVGDDDRDDSGSSGGGVAGSPSPTAHPLLQLGYKLYGFSLASPRKIGEKKEYDLQDEYRYLFDMRRSLYAFTFRRFGWDCLRHYELLGNGVIPFFIDLALAPPTLLRSLPKDDLALALRRPEVSHIGALWSETSRPYDPPHNYFVYDGKHKQDGGAHVRLNASVPPFANLKAIRDNVELAMLRKRLLSYSRKYLTTAAVAASVLERMGHANATRVLFLHGVRHMDFLKLTMHHGLANGLGIHVTSFPRFESHYQRCDATSLEELERHRDRLLRSHGNGYVYGFRVYDHDHGAEPADLHLRIQRREFDVVLMSITAYSNALNPQVPYFREVVASYPSDRIAFLVGDDAFGPTADGMPWWILTYASRLGHVFLRETYPLAPVCHEKAEEGSELLTHIPDSGARAALQMTSGDVDAAAATNGGGSLNVEKLCAAAPVEASSQPFFALPQPGSTVKPSHRAPATSADAILLNGEEGYAVVRQMEEIRAHSGMKDVLLVILIYRRESHEKFSDLSSRGELDKGRPILLHYQAVAALPDGIAQKMFLAAAIGFLRSATALVLKRVAVVFSNTVFFHGDVFADTGGASTHLWVARHAVGHNEHHRGMFGFCFSAEHAAKAATQMHIGHEIFGGKRHWLLSFAEAIANVTERMRPECGFDAALGYVVHNRTFDGVLSVFGPERGPVVFDYAKECDMFRDRVTPRVGDEGTKDVRVFCCSAPGAEVMNGEQRHCPVASVVVGDSCHLVH